MIVGLYSTCYIARPNKGKLTYVLSSRRISLESIDSLYLDTAMAGRLPDSSEDEEDPTTAANEIEPVNAVIDVDLGVNEEATANSPAIQQCASQVIIPSACLRDPLNAESNPPGVGRHAVVSNDVDTRNTNEEPEHTPANPRPKKKRKKSANNTRKSNWFVLTRLIFFDPRAHHVD